MNPKQTLIVGVLAGIGASLCCVAPLVLLSLGIGGAWVANLTVLEPVRPLFMGFALLFIGLSFRHIISRLCHRLTYEQPPPILHALKLHHLSASVF